MQQLNSVLLCFVCSAPEWNYVDPKQKQALDKQVDDGEFW